MCVRRKVCQVGLPVPQVADKQPGWEQHQKCRRGSLRSIVCLGRSVDQVVRSIAWSGSGESDGCRVDRFTPNLPPLRTTVDTRLARRGTQIQQAPPPPPPPLKTRRSKTGQCGVYRADASRGNFRPRLHDKTVGQLTDQWSTDGRSASPALDRRHKRLCQPTKLLTG